MYGIKLATSQKEPLLLPSFWWLSSCCPSSTCHDLDYASCIEQPLSRLFLYPSASLNYLIFGGDVRDAFAHSPAPIIPTFVASNDVYSDWYLIGTTFALSVALCFLYSTPSKNTPKQHVFFEVHFNTIMKNPGFGIKSTRGETSKHRCF